MTAPRRPGVAVRYADLILLALALPIFVLADLPLLGYAVAAVAWLAQHGCLNLPKRSAAAAIARGPSPGDGHDRCRDAGPALVAIRYRSQ